MKQQRPINILGIRKRTMLYHTKTDTKQNITVWMEAITKEIENKLDYFAKKELDGYIQLPSGVTIHTNNIKLYGEINLNNNKDKNYIKNTTLVNDDRGFKMYSNLDYNTGIINPIDGKIRWYNCWNNLNNFKLHHCYIGKPERIIIYKQLHFHEHG